ncbi:hypothetical protein LVW35_05965 [Pseudomonas sp. HN11]|uniref:hypothetical protein n=1 Tax=Pseudomonas sp. HN11 TaxID=1344094 RepID=UPI001F28A355|nr:hypothetical protein [Pseudomonas sp. HN11]UII72724.1 hypothetical protein LVW35_05965 [Pseudomonas sp. HN11]
MVKLDEISAIERWVKMCRTQRLVEALDEGAAELAQKDLKEPRKEKPGYAGFESDESPIEY